MKKPGGLTNPERSEHEAPDSSLSSVAGPWSMAILMLVTCVVVWTTVDRFMDPVGEKYVIVMSPGGADFFSPFGGARALLLGANPYRNNISGLDDPWKQDYLVSNGQQMRGIYPPTHFILYLPLALVTDNFRKAGRVLFAINLASLAFLSCVTWWLIARIGNLNDRERRYSTLLIPLIFVVLTCNAGTSLALERGDGGDILAAAFCWSAVVLFLNRRFFVAMFLMVPASLIKGYAVFCGFGIGLLGLRKGSRVPTVAGGLVGLLIFFAPVIRYVPDALEIRRKLLASTDRVPWMSLWWNHGFRNVFKQLAPPLAHSGPLVMVGCCAAIAVVSWLKARRSQQEGRADELTLWVVLFTTSAVEVLLGANPQSVIYNLVLVMPGVLIVMIVAPVFARACGLSDRSICVLGVLNLGAAFCLFKFKLFRLEFFPLAGVGMILFLLVIGGVMFLGWYRLRHLTQSTVAHGAEARGSSARRGES